MKKKDWAILLGVFLLVLGVSVWSFQCFQSEKEFQSVPLEKNLKREVSDHSNNNADSTLFFEPTSKNLAVGDEFSLEIKIDPGKNEATAVEMEINYPKSSIECQNLTTDNLQLTVLMAGALDNTTGKATITLGVRTDVGKITTSTKLATLTCSVKAAGTAVFSFGPASKVAARNEIGNVLKTAEKATLSLN